MPDHRTSVRLLRSPTKPKRTAPPDAAYQLLTGRSSLAMEENAWACLRHPTPKIALRYGADSFGLLVSVRNIVRRLEKLARVQRWQPGLFLVSIDEKGNRYLDARPLGISIFELFTRAVYNRVRAVIEHFPDCDLHPYFRLLLDALHSGPGFEIEGRHCEVEIIANQYFFEQSRLRFVNHPHIYQILDNLNFFFAGFYQSIRNSREKAKSFRRTPLENRRRLMQFACHLLDGESQTVIAHLTIRRDIKVIGGDPPISRGKSEELRKKLVKHITREIPGSDYLGHAILLKQDAILGCWMEAFVFFTKNALVQNAEVVAKLVNRWNGEIGPGRAGCIGEMLFQAYESADKRYGQTLDRIVLVTEPDFYCRVSAEGLHRFWCTQSPVGKLAERTKQSKRRAAQGKKAADAESVPMNRLQQMKLLDLGLEQPDRWTSQRKQCSEKISGRNKEAARKRSPRKSSPNTAASAHIQTYMAAISYASIAAANDESNESSRDAADVSATSQERVPGTNLQSRPSAKSEAIMSSTDNTSATTVARHRPIRLERRQTDVKEGDSNRERTRVEIRKKRKLPPPKPAD